MMRMASLEPMLRGDFTSAAPFVWLCQLYHHTEAWQNTDRFLQSWELLVPGLWRPNPYHHRTLLHSLSSYTRPCPTQSLFIIGTPAVQKLVRKHVINPPGRDLSPKPIAITDNRRQKTSHRWSFREGRRWRDRSLPKLSAADYWDMTMFSNP